MPSSQTTNPKSLASHCANCCRIDAKQVQAFRSFVALRRFRGAELGCALACDEPMAGTIDADMVQGFIEMGDLEGLQTFAPPKFDWTLPLGKEKLPALIRAVDGSITGAPQNPGLKIVEWLLKVGADPEQKLPVDHPSCWVICKAGRREETQIRIYYAGHSAVSFVLACLQELKKRRSNADWSRAEARLKATLSLLSRSHAAKHSQGADVTVPRSTLDLWESMRDLTASHNVMFECSDRKVSAHDQILMLASPVLKVMLTSAMKEGSSWLIQVTDSSSSGVSLFLDLLYTSSTREDPDHKTMLEALDLAHRWQVHGVVQTLCKALRDMIDANSFVVIAEAASLKGLETLERACAHFGSQDEQVQAMLQKGSLPTAVRKLLGEPAHADSGEQDAKKRKIFCSS